MKSIEIKNHYIFAEDVVMMRMYNWTEIGVFGKKYTNRGVTVYLRTRDYPYNIELEAEEYEVVKDWAEGFFNGRLILC